MFKPRQPRWLKDDAEDENLETDSQSDYLKDDSLRDIQDISLNLKFPLDGERNGGRENLNNSVKPEDQKSKIENAILTWSKGGLKGTQKIGVPEKVVQTSGTGKFPSLRRRHMFVIAVDSDSIADLFRSVKKIFEAVAKEMTEGLIGFILATSFTMLEVQSFLVSEGISPIAFDAYICNSGSDLYYSSPQSEENPFVVDLYYHSHIEYYWGGEGLRKTLARWAATITDKKGEDKENVGAEDENISTGYCYDFNVGKPEVVPPIKEVRKLMRIQALRCHIIYCQNGKKINVIPVLASRAQALRYLCLRQGMDLSNTTVFVGESGDTDYEQLIGGMHKFIILKGVGCGSSKQLHGNRSYPLADVVPVDSPNIVQISEECNSTHLRASLGTLGVLKC